jgi:CHAT domain-containing protein/tetratricopeptide (TPR) repeat protein
MNTTMHIVLLSLALSLVGHPGVAGKETNDVEIRSLMGQGRYSEAFDRVRSRVVAGEEAERLYDLLVEVAQYSGRSDDLVSFLHVRVRDGKGVVRSLSALGQMYMCGAQWREAFDHFERSLSLGDRSPRTYAGLQASYEKLYGTEDAIAHLLALSHTEGVNGGIWYALGLAYWSQWDLNRALSAVDQALAEGMHDSRVAQLRIAVLCSVKPHARHRTLAAQELAKASMRGDLDGEAFMRWVLVTAFNASGFPDSASAVQQHALRLARENGQLGWLAHFTLGDAHKQLADGKVQDALRLADSATAHFVRAGDHDGVLSAHSLRMSILFESGRYAEGLDYCFRILGQLDGHSDPRLLAGASIDAAWILSHIGANRIALVLGIRAESILEKISYAAHDNSRLGATLGAIHLALGDSSLARRYLYSALRSVSAPNPGDQLRASCEGSVGDLLSADGETVLARMHYMKQWEVASAIGNRGEQKSAALSLARVAGVRSNPGESEKWAEVALRLSILAADRNSEKDCHLLLGRLAEKRCETDRARREYKSAAQCLQALRPLRFTCSLMKETRDWYVDQHCETVQALMRIGAIGDGVCLLERARIDVDLHSFGMLKQANLMDPSIDQHALLQQLQAVSASLHRWVFSTSLNRVAYSDSTLRSLGEFFVHASPELIRSFNIDASRNVERISEVSQKQAIVAGIPADVVVLDVLFGKRETEVIAMTQDTLVHHTIRAGRGWFSTRIDAMGTMGSSTPRMRGEKPGRSRDMLFMQIGDSLLQGLAKVIRPRKDLIVVGDGPHSRIPFEVLSLEDESSPTPLVLHHSVSYRPSLWEFPPLGRATARLNRKLLVLADATWGSGMRAMSKEGVEHVLSGPVGPTWHDVLPGGRTEVAMLEALFGSRVSARVGNEASKETFLDSAPEYSIVHLSTHSAVRTKDYPEHVFYLSPSAVSNGEVGIADILSLDLSTSLVVLPSCYSGSPSEVGDVESLARAFLDAGASSVLAARWPIDDGIAVEFLREFYGALSKGCGRSEATQRGMLSLMSKGYTDRSVWAAFQLFGEVGPLPDFQNAGTSEEYSLWSAFVLGGTLISIAAGILWGRRRAIRLPHPNRKRRE